MTGVLSIILVAVTASAVTSFLRDRANAVHLRKLEAVVDTERKLHDETLAQLAIAKGTPLGGLRSEVSDKRRHAILWIKENIK